MGARGRLPHPEHHRTQRVGWLRAAVLGANDGIVSTASLMSDDLVDDAVERLSAAGLSPEFIEIARTSGQRGCWLLRFDADADLDPDLPVGGYGLDADEPPAQGM